MNREIDLCHKQVGVNGTKFPGIREHLKKNIAQVYSDMPTDFESFPADDVKSDPTAFTKALDSMREGTILNPSHLTSELR